ncbi:DUF421 domain-containing protein [Oceanobacillus rekensis]|uniref:DUF421 domain-containing protein n=1 Tax=Oceanobacillus rekensis TaxID=937927 RepID=UPI000B446D9A|nr:DUF421 domain-containing protein [Oceanobacillus rekensis]
MDTSITIKVVIGLLGLLVVIRLLGKKELSQLTPFDFVYMLVLGGLVEDTIYDDLVTVWEMLYAVALWAVLIFIIELIVRKFDKLRPIIKGEPSIIINDGVLDVKQLKKNKLESEQLRTMLRQQGIFSIKDVKFAILEPSGQLSIMEADSSTPVTAEMLNIDPGESTLSHLLVDEGRIEKKVLQSIGKDEKWLIDRLNKEGYSNVRQIYYAEWSKENGFVVKINE